MRIQQTPLRRIVIYSFLISITACLKQAPTLPPSLKNYDPALAVNKQLYSLVQSLPAGNMPVLIDSDFTVAVIVRADDESGNFHEQLVVEDSTAGISLLLNTSSLYLSYPIGRKLYIRLKGLYIGNDHGLPQLGAAPAPDNSGVLQVTAIPAASVREHIVTAGFPGQPDPVTVTMSELNSPRPELCNRLIRIDEAEFSNPLWNSIYSEPAAATSIQLQDCSGNHLVLRTSNYARFQGAATPWGKGSITGIYSLYNNLPQLVIRDTSDVLMNNTRCDGSVPVTPATVAIDSIRHLYIGKDTLLTAYQITGVVTSDVANRNNGSGNITLQEGHSGILIYLGSSATDIPLLGDSVTIDVSGTTLTKYNGMLEIKNLKSSRIRKVAGGRYPQAVTLSIAALNADFNRYESVLVKIEGARLLTGGNYSGNKTLDDGTGSILLYTASSATFASQPVPAINKTFQGIVTLYDTVKELKIRNPVMDVY